MVRTPDVLNPVSMSPVVSTNGRAESDVAGSAKGTAYSRAHGHCYCLFLGGGGAWGYEKSQKHDDNIQSAIMTATEGAHERALNNVRLTVERRGTRLFLGPVFISDDEARVSLDGALIHVR